MGRHRVGRTPAIPGCRSGLVNAAWLDVALMRYDDLTCSAPPDMADKGLQLLLARSQFLRANFDDRRSTTKTQRCWWKQPKHATPTVAATSIDRPMSAFLLLGLKVDQSPRVTSPKQTVLRYYGHCPKNLTWTWPWISSHV